MTDLLLFVLGLIITAVTVTALVLVGRGEGKALEQRTGRDANAA